MKEIKGLQERMTEFRDRFAKREIKMKDLVRSGEKKEEEEDVEKEFNNEGKGGRNIRSIESERGNNSIRSVGR